MQIKSQPLANKILGVADKTSFTDADFTLPTCNKIYPLISVLPKHQAPTNTDIESLDNELWKQWWHSRRKSFCARCVERREVPVRWEATSKEIAWLESPFLVSFVERHTIQDMGCRVISLNIIDKFHKYNYYGSVFSLNNVIHLWEAFLLAIFGKS